MVSHYRKHNLEVKDQVEVIDGVEIAKNKETTKTNGVNIVSFLKQV